jgi:lycopene beta-cyclase
MNPARAGDAEFDVVFAGGGLAAGLCALALRQRWPRLRLALCEGGANLGGNHTWSFFASDVGAWAQALLQPMVIAQWDSVEVAFPDHRRRLPGRYCTISSAAFDQTVRPVFAAPGSELLLGQRAVRVSAHEVELEDGRCLRGKLICDGRGPGAPPRWPENQGFQKFVGLELEVDPVAASAGFATDRALLMDATVAQDDGFRFVYVLPLSRTRLLVEDTYYADQPAINRPLLRARVHAYLAQRGIRVQRIVREESGALPLPWSDDSLPPLGSPLRLGARGGWFHPTTGYSLPQAAQVAQVLATCDLGRAPAALATLFARVQRQAGFARRLNRLLFRAGPADARWHIFSRFYRLPLPSIARFHRLETTAWDRARILLGRPPRGISLAAAFSALQTV